MMFATLSTIILAVSATVSAVPNTVPRQVDTSCEGLVAAFSSGGPYTLLAINSTDFNATQGVPLVVSPVIGSSAPDPNGRSLATYDTYPHYDYPNFSLDNGELLAGGGGASGAAARFTYIAGPLDFEAGSANPDTSFCGQAGTSAEGPDTPFLMVYNDLDGFSLCQSTSVNYPTPLNVVIYRPDNGTHGLYDYDSCYSIYIQLISV